MSERCETCGQHFIWKAESSGHVCPPKWRVEFPGHDYEIVVHGHDQYDAAEKAAERFNKDDPSMDVIEAVVFRMIRDEVTSDRFEVTIEPEATIVYHVWDKEKKA